MGNGGRRSVQEVWARPRSLGVWAATLVRWRPAWAKALTWLSLADDSATREIDGEGIQDGDVGVDSVDGLFEGALS
jgi:hypothetical protein